MRRLLDDAVALGLYALTAIAFTWPLAPNFRTSLPGDPGGDTGVYVWNLWVFAREWRASGNPLATTAILPLAGGADLSLHNYSMASSVVALPLLERFGPVGTYNLLLLWHLTLAAFATYLLCRTVTGARVAAWIGGFAFAFSPVLTARTTAHFSLVAVAPLPLLALTFIKALEARAVGAVAWALAAGGCLAWAAYSDAYYGVFGLVLLAVLAAVRSLRIDGSVRPGPVPRAMWGLAGAAAAIGVLVIVTGGTTLHVGRWPVHARSPFTAMTVAAGLLAAALLWRLAPRLRRADTFDLRRLVTVTTVCVGAGTLLLSPWLSAVANRLAAGRGLSEPIHWRSSPAGLDLLAFVLPNPSNPLWAGQVQSLLETWRPDAIPEHVGSLSLVAIAIVLAQRLRRGGWPAGAAPWLALTVTGLVLAIGPFLTVAGVTTGVPGPWSLLRYVPVVGWARSPSRFIVLATLGLAVLLALACRDLLARRRGPLVVPVLLALLVVELSPAPRTLHAATAPSIYRIIAADPDPNARGLELPPGIRDGTSSLGDFRTRTQFYQTAHGKPIVGGYLSRVSDLRRRKTMKHPTMRALIRLSAGETLDPDLDADGRLFARQFVIRARVGHVVIDARRVSPALRQWAIDALELRPVATSNGYELYRPAAWPPPDPLREPEWQRVPSPGDRPGPRDRSSSWPSAGWLASW